MSDHTVRVTWTVEYDTSDHQPETEEEKDMVIELLLEAAPEEVRFRFDREFTWEPIGWRVEHPEYGDMSGGTLMDAIPADPAVPFDFDEDGRGRAIVPVPTKGLL